MERNRNGLILTSPSLYQHTMGMTAQEKPERPRLHLSPFGETDHADYVRAVRAHLKNGNRKHAYRIALHAVSRFPDNALILSYYGYLQAVVDRKYRSGIYSCRKALDVFKPANEICAELAYPVLYLNLGRACLAAGMRREAIDAFEAGLRYDNSHGELLMEQQMLDVRKKPPMPFLSRSHPLNKYLGIFLHNSER